MTNDMNTTNPQTTTEPAIGYIPCYTQAFNVLELFAGSRSIGKAAEKLGFNVCSVDLKPFDGIDIVCDIEDLRVSDLPFIPDVIWASPPCTTFSIAAISHHRNNTIAISDFAKKSDRLVKKTLQIIRETNAMYYIENPVGMLRKMPYMKNIPRTTVTYCSYGDNRMKPTDIWSNNIRSLLNEKGWNPRPKCHNGNVFCHHEAAPRGSKTGTQGLRNDFERSKIPVELCTEILLSALHSYACV